MSVRAAAPSDVPTILALIRELADYERAAHEVAATTEDLDAALFGPRPAAYAHVAESTSGEVVGFALWFRNFSTWTGKPGIWLEDLYVQPDHRGAGHGLALLRELARTCAAEGYPRLDWWVLDWNEPALRFYRSLGAVAMDEWTVHRLTGDALAGLAARPAGEGPSG